MDAFVVVQMLVGRLLHHRGQVDGIDQLHIGESVCHTAQGSHDVGHGLTVVFPTMAGDKDDFAVDIIQLIQDIGCKVVILAHGCL